MLKSFVIGLTALLLSSLAWAADATGKWTAQTEGPRGAMTQTFVLKADGGTLTGTVEGMRGGSTAISDGKVEGDDISFTVTREFRGNQMKMNYKGKVSADTIHFTVTRDGGEGQGREFDAKRAS